MDDPAPTTSVLDLAAAILWRWALLALFWLLLAPPLPGAGLADLRVDLAVGAVTAALATWVSLRLAPPLAVRPRLGALARLAGRLLRQSVVAGIAAGVRALLPRAWLRPGLFTYTTRLRPGAEQALFGALTAAVPGAVPVGSDAEGRLLYHSLDTRRRVTGTLAVDEALLTRALVRRAR